MKNRRVVAFPKKNNQEHLHLLDLSISSALGGATEEAERCVCVLCVNNDASDIPKSRALSDPHPCCGRDDGGDGGIR